ncbi:MAG TPA: CDP-diacylglycerol--glycerol-3-phosphate 3-phosphatidyltransferase [Sphaerochaeta sp.]|jgi:CDP-diacylglycerol--glycerol-3-phosphate 3-phosphatidyltransferase|nr:CDP-diacylglycerol--glycerol-3-phosphate 3-phosphatidyltransferase [Spirochaetota bacterium]HOE84495.1 CDP-diacylglycerol--glycerol-3-phosphate 3-phosphatidyltransferase [Sphaerochaeta sp.]HOQ94262.1 CDP-diacylglycerol--glycerol-3-phosphate 3-phosphatidyltransferase [Sphaerochaeta sp.]HPK47037.1 CDP-diacylglycerol--glycerol-3-phosphate 3-phosphatidyltransferase [Sphaerochaeta sp.]
MNTPNKLTVSRLVMAPIFFIAFHLPIWVDSRLSKLSAILIIILWVLTELSDLLDGQIARRANLVTDLGKVMDPFADTISRMTYFVCFISVSMMPIWAFILIMWRELSILFVRMLMMGKGAAVPANIWGKSKAVLYAISGALGILAVNLGIWAPASALSAVVQKSLNPVFALAAAASVISFLTYVKAIIKSGALSSMSR